VTGERRVLVAGIGNIFFRDDAFGVEVVRRIDAGTLPDGVDVVDYGIRGVHLAYELLDGRYATLVLVDAVPMDEPPGTLAVLDVSDALRGGAPKTSDAFDAPAVDAHGMSPAAVLSLLRTFGATVDRVLVVGCQPAAVGAGMELSEPVQDAVERAVRLVADVVDDVVAAHA
jgi:hydrogenase maturation protease